MKRTPIMPSDPPPPSVGATTFGAGPAPFASFAAAVVPVSCSICVPFIEQ